MAVLKLLKQALGMEKPDEEVQDLNEKEQEEIKIEKSNREEEAPKENIKKKEEISTTPSFLLSPTKKRLVTQMETNKEEEKFSLEKSKNEKSDTIFVTPKGFEDCKKIANYIKNDKIVTINFEDVPNQTAQRLIDFLSGAMEVKQAQFIPVSKKVYTSVPLGTTSFIDGEE